MVTPNAEKDTPCPVCKGAASHAAACSVPVLGAPRYHLRAGRLHLAATCSGEPGCVIPPGVDHD